jgi:hypothetical protein
MEINADFSKQVAVHAAWLPWIPSPIEGVDRHGGVGLVVPGLADT